MGSILSPWRWLETLCIIVATQLLTGCGEDSAGVPTISEVMVTVTPSNLVLSTGEVAKLEAAVHDSEGRPVTGRPIEWSSSAPEIASVSPSGIVTALAVGKASIGAYSQLSVGFAQVLVQVDFGLPASGNWLIRTEIGTVAVECPGNEGGLRVDGSRDCSHAGVSRYSLDLAELAQWTGTAPPTPAPEVYVAADGWITDICIQPPTEVTCGTNGPFVLVEHAGGLSTIYAHLDPGSVVLRRKTEVRRGEPLGVMGRWGTDPAPWLHFELRSDNRGATAAPILEAVRVGGRPIPAYRAGDTAERPPS